MSSDKELVTLDFDLRESSKESSNSESDGGTPSIHEATQRLEKTMSRFDQIKQLTLNKQIMLDDASCSSSQWGSGCLTIKVMFQCTF